MKKIKNISCWVLLAISLAFISISCNKEERKNELELKNECHNEQIMSYYNSVEIQKLDNKINYVPGKKTRKLTGKQAAQLIVKDVEGGFAGGNIGTLGGPLGTMGGAVAGAVISSAYAWWSNGWPWGTVIKADDKVFSQGSISGVGTVGDYHNQYCRLSLISPSKSTHLNYTDFANFFMNKYSGTIANNLGLPSGFFSTSVKNKIIGSSLDAIEINDFGSASSFVNKYSNDQHVNSIMFLVLDRLFQIDSELNYELFYEYAELYAQLVQNDSNLTIEQKNLLLHSLSILKYSATLWRNNLQ